MSKLTYDLTEAVSKQFTTAELDDCVTAFTKRPSIAIETRFQGHHGMLWECLTGGMLLWFFLYESGDRALCEVRFPSEFGRPFLIQHMRALEQNISARASRRGKPAPHRRTHRRGKGN